jgi:hypothetical protein
MSHAKDVCDNTLSIIDGCLIDKGEFIIPAIYVEILGVCLNDLMTSSECLDEKRWSLFVGTVLQLCETVLADEYSDRIERNEFIAYFRDIIQMRRSEYVNYSGLDFKSWSDNSLYVSFATYIGTILNRNVDLEGDTDVHWLFTAAFMPSAYIKEHIESIGKLTSSP